MSALVSASLSNIDADLEEQIKTRRSVLVSTDPR